MGWACARRSLDLHPYHFRFGEVQIVVARLQSEIAGYAVLRIEPNKVAYLPLSMNGTIDGSDAKLVVTSSALMRT